MGNRDQARVLLTGDVQHRSPYRISALLVTRLGFDAQSSRQLHALFDGVLGARTRSALEIRVQISVRVTDAERVGKLLGGRTPDVTTAQKARSTPSRRPPQPETARRRCCKQMSVDMVTTLLCWAAVFSDGE